VLERSLWPDSVLYEVDVCSYDADAFHSTHTLVPLTGAGPWSLVVRPVPVPEPSALLVIAAGVLLLVVLERIWGGKR
jgi:hypothetical protein